MVLVSVKQEYPARHTGCLVEYGAIGGIKTCSIACGSLNRVKLLRRK